MKNINYIEVDEVVSTNDHLKMLAIEDELPEGAVVVAQCQKNGRGQGGNFWESTAGKNLIFSLLLRPSFLKAEDMFMISKVVSLGIIGYLKGIDKHFTIKWPNDIYYRNKKLGGILIENQLLGSKLNFMIVGIGININQDIFESDAPNPISLKNIFNKKFALNECLNGILISIGLWYNRLGNGETDKISEAYFSYLYRNSSYHEYRAGNRTFIAKIVSVDNDGRLNLTTYDGEKKSFYFKEVEFVIT